VFWPEQMLKDVIACLVVLAVMAGAAIFVHHQGDHLLDAPADASATNYPARPEWYFLFLFQMLKYFEGPRMEILGAIGIPTFILIVLFLIPLLDKVLWRWLAHGFTVLFCIGLICGAAWLTVQAVKADTNPPNTAIAAIHEKQKSGAKLTHEEESLLRAREFNEQRKQATIVAERAIELANLHGIPPSGPLELLANDPMTRGPQLFAAHCAACHRINGTDGFGRVLNEPASSSDLAGFATRSWIADLLKDPMSPKHFGPMKKPDGDPAHTRMAKWVKDTMEENEKPADRAALLANFNAVTAYLEDESNRPGRLEKMPATQTASTQSSNSPATNAAVASNGGMDGDDDLIHRGRKYFMDTCNECHSYAGERTGTVKAPEMRGYGSVEWIEKFIENPADDAFYRNTGKEPAQMPAFKDKLSASERHLLAVWLHASKMSESGMASMK
jgi:ubiquinol-cytochrome c reductase cytochrome b subunit